MNDLDAKHAAVPVPDAAQDALRRWPIGEGTAWRRLSPKGTVLEITTAGGERFVLKDVLQGHAFALRMERLHSEHRVLRHLADHGVPVPVPLAAEDGQTYVIIRGDGPARDDSGSDAGSDAPVMVFTLHEKLHHRPERESKRAAAPAASTDPWERRGTWRNVGAAIAQLHGALASYPHAIPSWHIALPEHVVTDTLPAARAALTGDQRATVDAVFAESLDGVCESLTDLPKQYVHGDCHRGNILIAGGVVSGFIDVDHLPLGPKAYDLWYLLADRLKWRVHEPVSAARFLGLFPSLIAGYDAANSLSECERGALWAGMLTTLLSSVRSAAEKKNPTLLARNLGALVWTHRHRGEIRRRLGLR